MAHKVCPYWFLKSDDKGHLPKGPKRLYEMILVMEVLIMKVESIPALNERNRDNEKNTGELTDIFKKVVHIFMNVNPKRKFPDLVN